MVEHFQFDTNKRVRRYHLPLNVRMRRRYKQRAAPKGRHRCRSQRDRGIGSIFRFAKKLAKNPMVRNLGKMVLQEIPGVYEKGVKKKENTNEDLKQNFPEYFLPTM